MGTLTATWCIATLREIVQNMTFWAARVLKPQISSCISRIRSTVSTSPSFRVWKVASPGTQTSDTSKIEKPSSSIQSGLFSAQKKPFATVESTNPLLRAFLGRRIRVRLPMNDERLRVTSEEWALKYGLRRSAQVVKENTRSSDDTAAENQQPLRIDKDKGKSKADGKLVFKENKVDSGPETKSPVLNAETHNTPPGSSHMDKALDASQANDDSFPEYFVYRTSESFHGRSYDAAIWDSDGENDKSYAASTLGIEPESEGSNDISLEEDNADDEATDSTSSDDSDDTVSERNVEIEVESSDSSIRIPGKVGKLTPTDIDDFLYRAANVISGGDFIQLKPVQDMLENLSGVDLLDATWRSLESLDGQNPNLYSVRMMRLMDIVERLNTFLESQNEISIALFKVHHLTMALRMKDLDQMLRVMQNKGEYNLRNVLKETLRIWDGEKCMELLSDELLALSPEKFEKMLLEAYDVVSSDLNLLGCVEE
jgi:hypothetical protein